MIGLSCISLPRNTSLSLSFHASIQLLSPIPTVHVIPCFLHISPPPSQSASTPPAFYTPLADPLSAIDWNYPRPVILAGGLIIALVWPNDHSHTSPYTFVWIFLSSNLFIYFSKTPKEKLETYYQTTLSCTGALTANGNVCSSHIHVCKSLSKIVICSKNTSTSNWCWSKCVGSAFGHIDGCMGRLLRQLSWCHHQMLCKVICNSVEGLLK